MNPQLPYLTRHFSLAELIITNTGLENWPTIEERARLRALARYLEGVRAKLAGKPIIITSAFRSDAVNRAIGGSRTSAHRLGWAADFWVPGWSLYRLGSLIEQHGGFDQLIAEPSRRVVHVSIDPRQRGQVMTHVGGPWGNMEPGLDAAWRYAQTNRSYPPSAT